MSGKCHSIIPNTIITFFQEMQVQEESVVLNQIKKK